MLGNLQLWERTWKIYVMDQKRNTNQPMNQLVIAVLFSDRSVRLARTRPFDTPTYPHHIYVRSIFSSFVEGTNKDEYTDVLVTLSSPA